MVSTKIITMVSVGSLLSLVSVISVSTGHPMVGVIGFVLAVLSLAAMYFLWKPSYTSGGVCTPKTADSTVATWAYDSKGNCVAKTCTDSTLNPSDNCKAPGTTCTPSLKYASKYPNVNTWQTSSSKSKTCDKAATCKGNQSISDNCK
jgi:hypothetical protein